ncbi:MAG: cytochrome b/b6 domain-containing protein [Roseiarcus sp.]
MSAGEPNATPSTSGAAGVGVKIVVWDIPTRLFHWLAVALIVAAYATSRSTSMEWHTWAGEALLAILLFRLLWGVFGSQTARFSSFLASPRAAARHLGRLLRRETDRQVGHNPAGGWMVLLLLALMLGETLSGLYVGKDIAEEGPLSERVPAVVANLIDALHDRYLWDALLVAIAMHLCAILAYAALKRHNLLKPMITGRKTLPAGTSPPRLESAGRALLLLACGVAATIALVESL